MYQPEKNNIDVVTGKNITNGDYSWETFRSIDESTDGVNNIPLFISVLSLVLSSDGTILAVGASGEDNTGTTSSLVRIYTNKVPSAQPSLQPSDAPTLLSSMGCILLLSVQQLFQHQEGDVMIENLVS